MKRRLTKQPHGPLRKPRNSLTHRPSTLTPEIYELTRETSLNWWRTSRDFKATIRSTLGKNVLPKQKRNARVFERAKHKTTSCAPYKRQKIVSNTIVTSCPVNFDNTNLRKQTNVHLLWGQASLIVEEKSSTKIDFNKFARRQNFGKRRRF